MLFRRDGSSTVSTDLYEYPACAPNICVHICVLCPSNCRALRKAMFNMFSHASCVLFWLRHSINGAVVIYTSSIQVNNVGYYWAVVSLNSHAFL